MHVEHSGCNRRGLKRGSTSVDYAVKGSCEEAEVPLQQSATRHTDALVADDEVIEHPYADQAQGVA